MGAQIDAVDDGRKGGERAAFEEIAAVYVLNIRFAVFHAEQTRTGEREVPDRVRFGTESRLQPV